MANQILVWRRKNRCDDFVPSQQAILSLFSLLRSLRIQTAVTDPVVANGTMVRSKGYGLFVNKGFAVFVLAASGITGTTLYFAGKRNLESLDANWFSERKKNTRNFFTAELIAKRVLTNDTSLFTFHTNSANATNRTNLDCSETTVTEFHFPVLSHIFAVDAGNVYRPYTPLQMWNEDNLDNCSSTAQDKNTFALLVKNYTDGYISKHIHSLNIGQKLNFFGPEQVLEFSESNISLKIENLRNNQQCKGIKRLILLCTGTGIAPMLQISCSLLQQHLHIKVLLINFVKKTEDTLLLERLRQWSNENKNFDFITVCKPPQSSSSITAWLKSWYQNNWHSTNPNLKYGLIDVATLQGTLGIVERSFQGMDSTALIVCGTDSFLCKLCGPGHEDGISKDQPELNGILKELGFRDDQVFRL